MKNFNILVKNHFLPIVFNLIIGSRVIEKGAIKYNSSITTLSSEQIRSQVNTTITNFFTNNVQKFNKNYIHSALIKDILSTNSSITSALLTLKLQRRIIPVLNTSNLFTGDTAVKFRNPLKPGSILSSFFFITIRIIWSFFMDIRISWFFFTIV